jgi:hypothetical protein
LKIPELLSFKGNKTNLYTNLAHQLPNKVLASSDSSRISDKIGEYAFYAHITSKRAFPDEGEVRAAF